MSDAKDVSAAAAAIHSLHFLQVAVLYKKGRIPLIGDLRIRLSLMATFKSGDLSVGNIKVEKTLCVSNAADLIGSNFSPQNAIIDVFFCLSGFFLLLSAEAKRFTWIYPPRSETR